MHPINQRVNQAMNSSSTANSPLLSTDYTGSPYSRSLTSSATSSSSKSIDNIQQAASHGLDVSYQSFPFAYQDAYSSLFVSTLSAEDPDVRYFEQAEDASQSPASFESEDIYHSYRQQQRSLFSIDAKPSATVHSYDLTSDFPLLVSLSPEGSEAQTDLHSTTSDESSSFSWSLQESSSLYLSDYGSPAFAKDAALTYDQSLYQGLMPLFLVDSKLQKYIDTRVCSSSPSLSPRASKRPVASTDPSSTESILLPHPKRVKLDSTWSSGTTSIFSQEESQCQVMTPTMHRRSCSVTAHSSPTSDSQNGATSSYSSSNLSSSPQELLLSTEIPTAGLARKLKEQEMAIMRINQLRSRESRHRAEDGLPSGVHGLIVAPIQDDDISWGGLTVELRYDVVAWLLDVLPAKPKHFPTVHDSYINLTNHLHVSTETRFLAIMLFTRYFHRLGPKWRTRLGIDVVSSSGVNDMLQLASIAGEDSSQNGLTQMYNHVVWERMVWDVALGSLTIAVKFYHDFLDPLHPVWSRDFRRLASKPINSGELELTQKELLRTFGYQVYDPTPQAFLSEFGLALPSVEELMRSANGTDSWLMVKSSMWDILSEAIHEPDFIRFPTSLLTCASFINALVNYLQFTQEYGGKNQLQPKTSRDRAEQRVLKVVDEMNTVMGFHPDDLPSCRYWIAMVSSL